MGSLKVYFALFIGFGSIASGGFQALSFLLLLFCFGLREGCCKTLEGWQRFAIIHWSKSIGIDPLKNILRIVGCSEHFRGLRRKVSGPEQGLSEGCPGAALRVVPVGACAQAKVVFSYANLRELWAANGNATTK